jgi:hypothetical protein
VPRGPAQILANEYEWRAPGEQMIQNRTQPMHIAAPEICNLGSEILLARLRPST